MTWRFRGLYWSYATIAILPAKERVRVKTKPLIPLALILGAVLFAALFPARFHAFLAKLKSG